MSARKVPIEASEDEARVILDEHDPLLDLTGTPPDELPIAAEERPPTLGTNVLRRYRLVSFGLVVIDVLCVAAALLAAHAIRFGTLPNRNYTIGLLVALPLWIGVFHALGLYGPHRFSWLEELRRTVSAVGLGIVLIILLTFWFDVYLSRSWMAIALVMALGLELIARRVVRAYVSRQHARGSLVLRTLLVGNQDPEARAMTIALERSGSGYRPIGYVDATSPFLAASHLSPVERVAHWRYVMRQHRPDCVLIASPTLDTTQMLAVMESARREGVLMRVYAPLPATLASRITIQPLGKDGVALTLKPAGLSTPQRVVKRAMDLAIVIPAIVVASPILLMTAVAIRLTSGRPVLFRQERVTEGNRTFRIHKFRTMTQDRGRQRDEETVDRTVPFFKHGDDIHVTRLGRFLRQSSLDELPQLFDVLIGDMSLVGPRPLPADQVAANIGLLGARHEVRAGITGWWQIHGRSDLDPEEAVRLDHFYIENWSPLLDIYILARTVGALITGRGAY